MTPLLRSLSGEAVALSVAVPLSHLLSALLDNASGVEQLRPAELAALSASPSSPSSSSSSSASPTASRLQGPAPSSSGSLPSRPMSRQSLAQSVRRGVALLWFEATGSWASAVVVSERGHLLTCAHLLTGSSWMESAPETQEQPSASNAGLDGKRPTATRRLAPSQQICRGRCEVLGPDGFFQEVTFEAQVLCVCEGYLDAALLLARPPSRSPDSKSRGYLFEPWIWQRESRRDPEEGTAVWAVGHGLFGPGTPWRGATLTEGHVVKVARSGCFPGGRAAVLQSCAAVHRGCSGGALVDACT
ncbi:unnamed protein product, partial [Polarella glacialis]